VEDHPLVPDSVRQKIREDNHKKLLKEWGLQYVKEDRQPWKRILMAFWAAWTIYATLHYLGWV
jgi:transposase